MWRSVLGVIVGLVVGGVAAFAIELPALIMHPLPQGIRTNDRAAMAEHVGKLPTTVFTAVALAWTVAPLVAAFVAALIVRRQVMTHAIVLGVIFLTMDVMNLRSIPSPWWLNVVGIVAPLPAAILGVLIAGRFLPAQTVGPQRYDMRERNMAC